MGTLHAGKAGSDAAPESEDLGFRAQKTVPRNSSSDLDGRLSATSFFLLLSLKGQRRPLKGRLLLDLSQLTHQVSQTFCLAKDVCTNPSKLMQMKAWVCTLTILSL